MKNVAQRLRTAMKLAEKTPPKDVLQEVAAASQRAAEAQDEEIKALLRSREESVKVAAKRLTPRQERIAERIDDVALGVLAAPYASKIVQKMPGRNVVSRTVRSGARAVERVTESPVVEAGALIALMPSVHKRLAKKFPGRTKRAFIENPNDPLHTPPTVRKKGRGGKLTEAELRRFEKVAEAYYPDYEYLTEPEKLAVLGAVRNIGVRAVRALRGIGKAPMTSVVDDVAKAKVPTPKVEGPGTVMSPGSTPVTTTAKKGRTRTALKAMGLIGGGTVLYGGYKGIGAAANLMSHHNNTPWRIPSVRGMGRSF